MKTYLISGYSMFGNCPIVFVILSAKNEKSACRHQAVKHLAILKVKEV